MVAESTYLGSEQAEATARGHMTAADAANWWRGRHLRARRLVLTHFSQRYTSLTAFGEEARALHAAVVVTEDLAVVHMPRRPA